MITGGARASGVGVGGSFQGHLNRIRRGETKSGKKVLEGVAPTGLTNKSAVAKEFGKILLLRKKKGRRKERNPSKKGGMCEGRTPGVPSKNGSKERHRSPGGEDLAKNEGGRALRNVVWWGDEGGAAGSQNHGGGCLESKTRIK